MHRYSMEGIEAEIPILPVSYSWQVFRFLKRRGISREAATEGLGIEPAVFDNPEGFLSMKQARRSLERVVELVPDPKAGFEYGLSLDLASHGLMGFAVLSNLGFRDLVAAMIQYIHIRIPLMELSAQFQDGAFRISVRDTWPLGKARPFVVQTYMGSICNLSRLVSRRFSLAFDFPAPLSPEVYEKLAGCPVQFSQKENFAWLPMPESHQRATTEGREGLIASQKARQNLDMEDETELLTQVRHFVGTHPGRECTLEKAAEHLNRSPRSMRRQLREAGFSFTTIRNEIREKFATSYLKGTALPLEKIAERLGYSDPASFSKAFRSWTGKTPGEIRRARRGRTGE